jgi:hypothetical protein
MMDFDWQEPSNGWVVSDPTDNMVEMITTYVPEAEYMTFEEADLLSRQRDWDAAVAFEETILYGT